MNVESATKTIQENVNYITGMEQNIKEGYYPDTCSEIIGILVKESTKAKVFLSSKGMLCGTCANY